MSRIFNSIISNVNLLILYKNIWSAKKVFAGVFNLITGYPVSFPLTINLLITDKCNNFCKMCFYKKSHCVNYDSPGMLTLDEIREFIIHIRDHQPLIHIGGGEPFMRDDLLDIIYEIKKSGMKCLITTNGSLMNNVAINRLIALKVDVLIVSLYGPENIHDEITGVRGGYKKTFENLKYVLKKRDKHTRVLVSSIVLPENILVFNSFLADLQSLGIDGVKLEQMNFLTRNEYNSGLYTNTQKSDVNLCPSVYIIDEEFNQKFVTDLITLHRDIRRNLHRVYMKPYLSQAQMQDWYCGLPQLRHKCSFITHSVFINYNGDILPCQFFTNCIVGNIKKDSLAALWPSERYQGVRKTITTLLPSICMRCCKN